MKIIGAHDTITGQKAKNFFAKAFPLFCKCQNKNILELCEAGVTCFDLRIWYDNDWHYGHGLGEYDYDNIFSMIDDIVDSISEQIYIRLILERPFEVDKFINLCSYLEKEYPDIIFFEGRVKKTWEKVYTFNREDELPTVIEYHASVSGKGLLKYMPYLFWRFKGKKYKLQEGINLIDFV